MNLRYKTSTLVLAIAGFLAVEAHIGAASAQIDEIIVTARKREESLQTVPVAVTALTGTQMERAGFAEISDLNQMVPSFYIREEDGYSNTQAIIIIRGQEPASQQTNTDPSVGVYIDGVNIPHPVGLQTAFFDLERVEVLKGPQGTLYGRNTNGGALLMHSKRPDFDGVHGKASVDVGNYNMLNYRGAINIPVIEDKFAVRLAGQRTYRQGFGESAIGQKLGGAHDQWFFRGSAIFEPIERVRLYVSGDYLEGREAPAMQTAREYVGSGTADFAISAYSNGKSGCAFGDTVCARAFAEGVAARGSADFFKNENDLALFDDFNVWGLNGTLEIDVTDNIMFKSISGYRKFWDNHFTDFDGGPFELLTTGHPDFPNKANHQESKMFSQEINLTGTSFDDRLEWLFGAFYSDDKTVDRDWVTFFRGALPKHFFQFDADPASESYAGFGQLSYAITDKFNFTTGGRWTQEKKSQSTAHVNVITSAAGGLGGVGPNSWSCRFPGLVVPDPGVVMDAEACRSATRSVTYSGFSWLFGVDYEVTDNAFLYAKHSRGFRGGGFDIRSPATPPFEPEFAFDIEIGAKTDWFDDRLRANVAAYRTKYSNKQEQTIIPGPATVTENAAQAKIFGAELEIQAEPTDGLTLGATAAWFKGEFETFPGALLENPNAHPLQGTGPDPLFPNQITADGEKMTSPTWTYSLFGRYERDICSGVAGIQANFYWRGETFTSDRRRDYAVTKSLLDEFDQSRHNLNMRADYDLPDKGVNLAVFVTNLLDKEYQIFTTAQSSVGGMVRGTTLNPRMFGAQLTYRFGEE